MHKFLCKFSTVCVHDRNRARNLRHYYLIFSRNNFFFLIPTLTVSHARSFSKFTEIKSNLRKKKLRRTNQGPNFLGSSFSNGDSMIPNPI